ncbi:MAG: family 20 glycosylhydrolase [Vicingaceae bacterium]
MRQKVIIALLCLSSCTLISINQSSSIQEPINYKGTQYHPINSSIPLFKRSLIGDTLYKLDNSIQLKSNAFGSNKLAVPIQLIENKTNGFPNQCALHLKRLSRESLPANLENFQATEYYQITFSKGQINISAFTESGCANGLGTLYYFLQKAEAKELNLIEIRDWPDTPRRVLQVLLKGMDPEVVKQVIERAWMSHYNMILLHTHNSVRFKSLKKFSQEYAMPVNTYLEVVDHIRALGIEVVPHFNFLTHQKAAFIHGENSNEMLYNAQTINPNSKEAKELIFQVIDEVDSLIHPAYFHIGFDEVVGHNAKQIEKYGSLLPAKDFLAHLVNVYTYLNYKGIETWIWGDMLLKESDFPDMHIGSLHANSEYANLIDCIPKDIVICDWHYREYKRRKLRKYDYSSLTYFTAKGFKTYGASYEDTRAIRAFSKNAYQENNELFQGMIATTWHKLLNGTVDRPSSDSLKSFDAILSNSAEAFWNASAIEGPPFMKVKSSTN